MQAFSAWEAPGGTLGRIVSEAAARVEALRGRRDVLARAAREVPAPASLAAALRNGTQVAVVAEVKRASPSKGRINPGLDAASQAVAYVTGGARAISVLTEPRHFAGSEEDLVAVAGAVPVPLLRKDFHVDVLQFLEARALGAAAVLLIARALGPERLYALAHEAHGLGLEVLVEVRDEGELEAALRTDAALIGVNNRNLETLAIDLATSERLVPLVPGDRIAVAESGFTDARQVERAAAVGADAVLVGSSVSAAADPAAAVRALTAVPRRGR